MLNLVIKCTALGFMSVYAAAEPLDTDVAGTEGDDSTNVQNPLNREGDKSTPYEKKRLELLTLEGGGESKRKDKWKDSLREKERLLRKHLEMEANASLANRADDLRRAWAKKLDVLK